MISIKNKPFIVPFLAVVVLLLSAVSCDITIGNSINHDVPAEEEPVLEKHDGGYTLIVKDLEEDQIESALALIPPDYRQYTSIIDGHIRIFRIEERDFITLAGLFKSYDVVFTLLATRYDVHYGYLTVDQVNNFIRNANLRHAESTLIRYSDNEFSIDIYNIEDEFDRDRVLEIMGKNGRVNRSEYTYCLRSTLQEISNYYSSSLNTLDLIDDAPSERNPYEYLDFENKNPNLKFIFINQPLQHIE